MRYFTLWTLVTSHIAPTSTRPTNVVNVLNPGGALSH